MEPKVSPDAVLCEGEVNSGLESKVPGSWPVGGQNNRVLSCALMDGGGGMPAVISFSF